MVRQGMAKGIEKIKEETADLPGWVAALVANPRIRAIGRGMEGIWTNLNRGQMYGETQNLSIAQRYRLIENIVRNSPEGGANRASLRFQLQSMFLPAGSIDYNPTAPGAPRGLIDRYGRQTGRNPHSGDVITPQPQPRRGRPRPQRNSTPYRFPDGSTLSSNGPSTQQAPVTSQEAAQGSTSTQSSGTVSVSTMQQIHQESR